MYQPSLPQLAEELELARVELPLLAATLQFADARFIGVDRGEGREELRTEFTQSIQTQGSVLLDPLP